MITITNNNIYKSDFSLIDLRYLEDKTTISEDEIVKYLSEEVELGESITFDRIFDIIRENEEEMNRIFHSCLGGFVMEPFITELDKLPTKKSDMTHLELFWFSDKSGGDVGITSSFHGIGIETSDNGPLKKGEIIAYAVEFTPLNNLKYLNLKLNKKLSIINYDSIDDKDVQLEIGDKGFTIYDLFYGILHEISWNGYPDFREDRLIELEESIEAANEEIEELESTDVSSFNVEELFELFDKNDKLLVKYNGLRDRVDEKLIDETDDRVESLKSCLLVKLKLHEEIEKSTKDLFKYYKKLTDCEFNMQLLYELDEDIKYHKFWETPKCTCPKIDNIVLYPKGNYIFDKKCPIHKKASK